MLAKVFLSSLEGFKGLNTVKIETSLKYDKKIILLATEWGFAVTQDLLCMDMVHGHFYSISVRTL